MSQEVDVAVQKLWELSSVRCERRKSDEFRNSSGSI